MDVLVPENSLLARTQHRFGWAECLPFGRAGFGDQLLPDVR
jgi:hypothetical protein